MSAAQFDLSDLILTLRPDLCKRFGFSKLRRADDFRRWLLLTGTKEYRSVLEDEGLLESLKRTSPLAGSGDTRNDGLSPLQHLVRSVRPDVRKAFPLPRKHRQFVRWFFTYGVEEHFLWPYLSTEERRIVMAHPEPWKSRLAAALTSPAEDPLPWKVADRGFGVNLIGYVFGQLGIGEDLRMAARSLKSADVPFVAVNFPPGSLVPQNDRELDHVVAERGEFAFNIFCLPALEHGRFYAERGIRQMAGRYNIGFWPWELGKWPEPWKQITALVDEVWVSSRHTLQALKPVCPVPVFLMPMAVETGEISSLGRTDFGLPENARLFCFAFDLNSSFHRKNPMGCINAFLRAFSTKRNIFYRSKHVNDDVGLVIKAHRPSKPCREWDRLWALASHDHRIHIIEKTLSRPDLLALYSCCDCFVSLHRAEGYGRGIAEAILLGLHVIATGYSGNVDFCAPGTVDLVDYRLVPIKRGQYPFGDGQVWAEADLAHAAALMKRFVEGGSPRQNLPPETFSCGRAGMVYRARLESVWGSIQENPAWLWTFPRTSRPLPPR